MMVVPFGAAINGLARSYRHEYTACDAGGRRIFGPAISR